jgi:curved DNA-binding protein CbpA
VNDHKEPHDLYQLLGVARDAPAAEITRAYHRRARMLHPDARPGPAGPAEDFVELEAAYRVLGNPARRAAYDQALHPPGCWPSPAVGASAPPWRGSRPPGAALWAGPVHISPPPGAAVAGDQAGARLAVLALLLARRLGAGPVWDWPW